MLIDFTAEEDHAIGPEVMTGELVVLDYTRELTKAQQLFESYRGELRRMEEEAAALVVTDEASRMDAVSKGSSAQGLVRAIKVEMEKAILKPNNFVASVRNIAKGLTEPLESIKKQCSTKIDTWLAEERRRKAELEEKARREARELQDRLNREAREKGGGRGQGRGQAEAKERNIPVEEVPVVVAPVEEVKIFEPIVEQPASTVRAESGAGTAFQKDGRWVYKVVDMAKVPVEYLLNQWTLDQSENQGGSEGDSGAGNLSGHPPYPI